MVQYYGPSHFLAHVPFLCNQKLGSGRLTCLEPLEGGSVPKIQDPRSKMSTPSKIGPLPPPDTMADPTLPWPLLCPVDGSTITPFPVLSRVFYSALSALTGVLIRKRFSLDDGVSGIWTGILAPVAPLPPASIIGASVRYYPPSCGDVPPSLGRTLFLDSGGVLFPSDAKCSKFLMEDER